HMHAVSFDRKRDIDAVVDDERHPERRQRRLERTRLLDHGRGARDLVAQLHQRCPTRGDRACEVNEIMPAGVLGIDDGIEAQIDLFHGVRFYSTWMLFFTMTSRQRAISSRRNFAVCAGELATGSVPTAR